MSAARPGPARPHDEAAVERESRRAIRFGLGVILAAFGGFGAWAAFAPLAGVALGVGYVKVDTNRKTVQHQEGGIVKSILVREGDKVAQGQLLILLEDVRVDAGADLLRTQRDAELVRRARLRAEQKMEPTFVLPEGLSTNVSDPRIAEAVDREREVLESRRTPLLRQTELLRAQNAQTKDEANALIAQVKALDEAVRYSQEELEANEKLLKDGFIQKTRLLGFQRAVAEYQSRRGEALAELAKTRQRSSELELRVHSLKSEYDRRAAEELKDTMARLVDFEERIRPTVDAAARQRIVAPVAGTVVDLKINTEGAAIGPREPLLDIVPLNAPLIVEVRIGPDEIENVHVGLPADVRLSAYRRSTALAVGKVIYVSADRLTDRTNGVSYYVVHVEVTDQALKEAGNLRIQAGMPAEVHIKVRPRMAWQYFLDPIMDATRRSFREP